MYAERLPPLSRIPVPRPPSVRAAERLRNLTDKGTPCPSCDALACFVIDSRFRSGRRIRRYRCSACQARWTTEEVIVSFPAFDAGDRPILQFFEGKNAGGGGELER